MNWEYIIIQSIVLILVFGSMALRLEHRLTKLETKMTMLCKHFFKSDCIDKSLIE